MILEAVCVGAATASTIFCVWHGLEYRRIGRALDRRRQFIEDTQVFPDPEKTELCGGCGHYLTLNEIALCQGMTCPRYNEVPQENKINTGYTGHLHLVDKKV